MTENTENTEQVDIADDEAEQIEVDDTAFEAGNEEVNPPKPLRYNISSYGWDTDVEGLVKRLRRGDIISPKFQRGSVWSRGEKSSFIESLILGLPIPSIFLAKDPETGMMFIIDGLQRLTALQSYYDCEFSLSGKGIGTDLKGSFYEIPKGRRTAKTLEGADKRSLDDATIHAVVIKQSDPIEGADNNYSDELIQIFKRLNTSGKPLNPQEIRACIFSGPFNDMLGELNNHAGWRNIFGPIHTRLKDIEVLLRVIALCESKVNYSAPMPSFLNEYMKVNRLLDGEELSKIRERTVETLNVITDHLTREDFRSDNTFLLTRFEAVFVGIYKEYDLSSVPTQLATTDALRALRLDRDYQYSVAEFVNDTDRVNLRAEVARRCFRV